eukprot:7553915-Pyramimonas_sp.AAC.1
MRDTRFARVVMFSLMRWTTFDRSTNDGSAALIESENWPTIRSTCSTFTPKQVSSHTVSRKDRAPTDQAEALTPLAAPSLGSTANALELPSVLP